LPKENMDHFQQPRKGFCLTKVSCSRRIRNFRTQWILSCKGLVILNLFLKKQNVFHNILLCANKILFVTRLNLLRVDPKLVYNAECPTKRKLWNNRPVFSRITLINSVLSYMFRMRPFKKYKEMNKSSIRWIGKLLIMT
jgi:hypothetical protein